jgi:methenyltetrahydrofolate cyclohydrolase
MDSIPFSQMALVDLLDAFASSDPVPGGGSAAALSGALGVSLLLMVGGMEKTRTGLPEEAADLAEAAARLRPLRDALVGLIEDDSDAYAAVVAAFKLPKDTDAHATARRAAIEDATRRAAEVPLETMRVCQQALRGAMIVARTGSRQAASDTGVAIELLMAALHGAALNVKVNLAALSDQDGVKTLGAERAALERDAAADAAAARSALS